MNPLDTRPHRIKNPTLFFFCPLCRTQRQLPYRSRLSLKQYFQIFVTGSLLTAVTFPYWGAKSLFWVFLVWATLETAQKFLYKRHLPCPHCGFDATWYKRDVRVARRQVQEFFAKQNKEIPEVSNENLDSGPDETSTYQ